MGFPGGIDHAGSLKSGSKLHGRLGDFDGNGMLDGAIVVTGNMPLNSVFMPGSPYALIRYFDTDMPYDGELVGKLPGTLAQRNHTAAAATYQFPTAATSLVSPQNSGETQ
jgi:hypothetical protein